MVNAQFAPRVGVSVGISTGVSEAGGAWISVGVEDGWMDSGVSVHTGVKVAGPGIVGEGRRGAQGGT